MSAYEDEVMIRTFVDAVVASIERCFADGRLRREDGATVARVTAEVVVEIGGMPHLAHIDAAVWDQVAARARAAIVRRLVAAVPSP